MKYWKDGFYDTPINGAVEITDEYYDQLLVGQSSGLLISENNSGHPILIVNEPTVEEVRVQKLAELRAYDTSDTVNQFHINSMCGWLSKSTRLGLINSINIEKEAGRTETGIWMNGVLFILPIEKAINILHQIELYALACFSTTQRHISAINQLEIKEEIEAYDYCIGYPGKLSFTG